jgi:hypothetical protein
MKKLTSLIFAMVSTMFLFVGATQAAEKLDALAPVGPQAISESVALASALPCILTGDEN